MSRATIPGEISARIVSQQIFNFALLFEMANEAMLRCPKDDDKELLDHTFDMRRKDAIAVTILVGAACEAFVNELGVVSTETASQHSGSSPAIQELSRTLPLLELARASVVVKFRASAEILYSTKGHQGLSVLQNFETLMGLRNELVHVKKPSVARNDVPSPSADTPKYAKLVFKEIEERNPPSYGFLGNYHWMRRLMRLQVAEWAYSAGLSACQYLLTAVEKHDGKLAEGFQREFPFTQTKTKHDSAS